MWFLRYANGETDKHTNRNADDKMFAILCMPVVDEVQWVDDIFATFQK